MVLSSNYPNLLKDSYVNQVKIKQTIKFWVIWIQIFFCKTEMQFDSQNHKFLPTVLLLGLCMTEQNELYISIWVVASGHTFAATDISQINLISRITSCIGYEKKN